MLKTHILSFGIPRKTTRKDIIQATASGVAYGAFHIISELASGLPAHMQLKGRSEMIAHYLEVQAFLLDQLSLEPTEEPPTETLQ